MEHNFTLVLTGINDLNPEVTDALYEAGCDDVTLSIRSGRVYLTFSRDAASLKDALLSAIRDVKRAGIGADVLRVDICNLVTQSDIGRRIGRSRQLVHQYITGKRGPGRFPAPVCYLTEGIPLWMWCEVACWLCQNDIIKEEDLHNAQHVAIINSVLDLQYQKHLDPQLAEEVLGLVGP